MKEGRLKRPQYVESSISSGRGEKTTRQTSLKPVHQIATSLTGLARMHQMKKQTPSMKAKVNKKTRM